MYITNPSDEDKKSWYSCKKKTADHLIYKQGFNVIYIEGNKFYFVKTKKLVEVLKNLSVIYKLIEKF